MSEPIGEGECLTHKMIDPIMVCLWSRLVCAILIVPKGIFNLTFGLQIFPFSQAANSWMVVLHLGPACITINKMPKEQNASKS